jgi:hypothetical protein
MFQKRAFLIGVMVAAFGSYGCQVLVASITSPSDWVSGTARSIGAIFEGISTSSGSGGGQARKSSYERDLREYSAAFVRDGGTREDFLRGVTRIAENHGITNWEAEPSTPFAIGQGMRVAKVSEQEMRAFCREFGKNELAAKLALEGWQSAGS